MPILPKDDPTLLGAKVFDRIETWLPNAVELAKQGDQARQLASREWQLDAGSIWQYGSQKLAGLNLAGVGMPIGQVFDALWDALKLPPEALDMVRVFIDVMREEILELTRELLEEAMEAGISLSIELASAIPVVGWVVDILWDIGNAIAKLVKTVKEQNRDPAILYERRTFNPEYDSLAVNHLVLGRVRSSVDWTPIFLPPGWGKPAGYMGAIGWVELEGGGYRISTTIDGGDGKVDNVGIVPGTRFCHRAWEVLPQTQAGHRTLGFIEVGNFLPSARDLSVSVWGLVTGWNGRQGPNPSMYTIDCTKARKAWEQYLGDLLEFIADLDWHDDFKRQLLQRGHEEFGWGAGDQSISIEDRVMRSKPVTELEKLRKNQLAGLDTIGLAYVDPNRYAAFDDDSELYGRWNRNKDLLLAHAARCYVDLDNVPDAEYRKALVAAGVGSQACMPIKGTKTPIGQDGGLPGERPKRQPMSQSGGAGGTTKKRRGPGLGLAVAAMAGLAAAARRR